MNTNVVPSLFITPPIAKSKQVVSNVERCGIRNGIVSRCIPFDLISHHFKEHRPLHVLLRSTFAFTCFGWRSESSEGITRTGAIVFYII
jgi:hypothetical protein